MQCSSRCDRARRPSFVIIHNRFWSWCWSRCLLCYSICGKVYLAKRLRLQLKWRSTVSLPIHHLLARFHLTSPSTTKPLRSVYLPLYYTRNSLCKRWPHLLRASAVLASKQLVPFTSAFVFFSHSRRPVSVSVVRAYISFIHIGYIRAFILATSLRAVDSALCCCHSKWRNKKTTENKSSKSNTAIQNDCACVQPRANSQWTFK